MVQFAPMQTARRSGTSGHGLPHSRVQGAHNRDGMFSDSIISIRRCTHSYSRQRVAPTCARRGNVEPMTRRETGIRIAKGVAASSLSVGLGAGIELTVRPVAGSAEEIAQLAGEGDLDAVAQACFEQAERDLAGGRYGDAVEGYSNAIKLTPLAYTRCMKSLLGRREAYFALGRRAEGGADNRQEFAWGRGIRWPGWYIIGAILFRNEWVRGRV